MLRWRAEAGASRGDRLDRLPDPYAAYFTESDDAYVCVLEEGQFSVLQERATDQLWIVARQIIAGPGDLSSEHLAALSRIESSLRWAVRAVGGTDVVLHFEPPETSRRMRFRVELAGVGPHSAVLRDLAAELDYNTRPGLRTLDRETGITLLYLAAFALGAYLLPRLSSEGTAALAHCLFWMFAAAAVCAGLAYLIVAQLSNANRLAPLMARILGGRSGASTSLPPGPPPKWSDAFDWKVAPRPPPPALSPRETEDLEEGLAFRTLFKLLVMAALPALILAIDSQRQVTSGIVLHTIAQTGFSVVAAMAGMLAVIDLALVVSSYALGSLSRRSGSGLAFWSAALALQLSRSAVHVFCGLAWLQVATWNRFSIYVAMLLWGAGCLIGPQASEWIQHRRRRRETHDELRRVAVFGYLISAGLALWWIVFTHHQRPLVIALTSAGLAAIAVTAARAWSKLPRLARWIARIALAPVAAALIVYAYRGEVIVGLLCAGVVAIGIRLAWWLLFKAGEARRWRVQLEASGPIPMGVTTVAYLVILVGLIAVPRSSVIARKNRARAADADFRARLERSAAPAPTAAVTWDHEIFVVSDSQIRAYGGRPTGAHLQVVEDLVASSLRPAVQDALAETTLRRFSEIFASAPAATGWVYLGDFCEISCRAELERFAEVKQWFGASRFLGAAAGNHDGFFLGNFPWAPDWDEVCPERGVRHGEVGPAYYGPAEREGVSTGRDFTAAVKALGGGLTGVFLDTSDYDDHFVGAAGVAGEISDSQCEWVTEQLAKAIGSPEDPVLLFAHHPISDLAGGAGCVTSLARRFRVLAVVSAHTHLAALRYRPGRGCQLPVERGGERMCIPELVAGSTTDAPQEAAWLRVGSDGDRFVLEVETVQPIDRLGGGAACLAMLADQPGGACARLLDDQDLFAYQLSPEGIQRQQRSTMSQLADCIGSYAGVEVCRRDRTSQCSRKAIAGCRSFESSRRCIDAAFAVPRARELMLCLSWGAAAYANRSIRLRAAVAGALRPHDRGAPMPSPHSPFRCAIDPEGDALPACAALR